MDGETTEAGKQLRNDEFLNSGAGGATPESGLIGLDTQSTLVTPDGTLARIPGDSPIDTSTE